MVTVLPGRLQGTVFSPTTNVARILGQSGFTSYFSSRVVEECRCPASAPQCAVTPTGQAPAPPQQVGSGVHVVLIKLLVVVRTTRAWLEIASVRGRRMVNTVAPRPPLVSMCSGAAQALDLRWPTTSMPTPAPRLLGVVADDPRRLGMVDGEARLEDQWIASSSTQVCPATGGDGVPMPSAFLAGFAHSAQVMAAARRRLRRHHDLGASSRCSSREMPVRFCRLSGLPGPHALLGKSSMPCTTTESFAQQHVLERRQALTTSEHCRSTRPKRSNSKIENRRALPGFLAARSLAQDHVCGPGDAR